MIEQDTELLVENSFVVLLQLFLRRRQVRAHGIIDEVQNEIAARLPIADTLRSS